MRGAMGRGVRVEGVRGAEIASFGIGEVVIGRDRFVVGCAEMAAGLRGFGRRWGSWSDWWRLGDADHRDRPGDRAVDLAMCGAFRDGEPLGIRRLGCVLACDGVVCWERRLGE